MARGAGGGAGRRRPRPRRHRRRAARRAGLDRGHQAQLSADRRRPLLGLRQPRRRRPARRRRAAQDRRRHRLRLRRARQHHGLPRGDRRPRPPPPLQARARHGLRLRHPRHRRLEVLADGARLRLRHGRRGGARRRGQRPRERRRPPPAHRGLRRLRPARTATRRPLRSGPGQHLSRAVGGDGPRSRAHSRARRPRRAGGAVERAGAPGGGGASPPGVGVGRPARRGPVVDADLQAAGVGAPPAADPPWPLAVSPARGSSATVPGVALRGMASKCSRPARGTAGERRMRHSA